MCAGPSPARTPVDHQAFASPRPRPVVTLGGACGFAGGSDAPRQAPRDLLRQAFRISPPRATYLRCSGTGRSSWKCFLYANGGHCTGALSELYSQRTHLLAPQHRHRLRRSDRPRGSTNLSRVKQAVALEGSVAAPPALELSRRPDWSGRVRDNDLAAQQDRPSLPCPSRAHHPAHSSSSTCSRRSRAGGVSDSVMTPPALQ